MRWLEKGHESANDGRIDSPIVVKGCIIDRLRSHPLLAETILGPASRMILNSHLQLSHQIRVLAVDLQECGTGCIIRED